MEELDTRKDPFSLGMNLPQGHLTIEDEQLLFKYSKGKVVVNIGTFKGRSTILMAYHAKKVYAIDNYPEYQKEVSFDEVSERLFDYNVELIKSLSHLAADRFDDKSIDVLFVDAGHAHDDVLNDFYAYKSKMKDGAIVIFHDWKYMIGETPDRDVRKPVALLVSRGEIDEVEIGGWCYVARMK